jgi:signal peptidase I
MKIIKGISEAALYVIVTVGLIMFIPAALSRVLHTPYPLAVVTSGSMWPTFKAGDLVLVKGVNGDVLGVSDIAVYKHENGFAIHRVIKKNEKNFITKGDANTSEDAPVSYNQLVGRAVEIGGRPLKIPFIGSIGKFLRSNFL